MSLNRFELSAIVHWGEGNQPPGDRLFKQPPKHRMPWREWIAHRSKQIGRFLSAPFRALPDFVVAGTPKSGSSSLYYYLGEHSQIIPAFRKEVRYFNTKNYLLGSLWYRKDFPLRSTLRSTPRKLTGDGTPYYFSHKPSVERMASMIPNAKIIVVLRNPIDRAYSQYQMAVRDGHEHLSFEDAITAETARFGDLKRRLEEDVPFQNPTRMYLGYLKQSCYFAQAQRLLRHYAVEQVRFVKAEDLFDNPTAVCEEVFSFLGLPMENQISFDVINPGQYTARMKEGFRKKLQDFFHESNQGLYKLIGRDMGWE